MEDNDVLPMAQKAEADEPKELIEHDPNAADAQKEARLEPKEEEKPPEEEKPAEPTEAEKELARNLAKERRRNQAIVRRMHEAEQAVAEFRSRLHNPAIADINQPEQDDSEAKSYTAAQLRDLVRQEAEKLAPQITKQQATESRLQQAAAKAAEELGERKFSELTNDLATILAGPQQLRVLATDRPADVIQYLVDPDNAAEADALREMDDFDFGRAMARIETKAKAFVAKANAAPQPSNAPRPLEAVRGQGAVDKDPSQMTDKEFAAWRQRQIAQRRVR